jgi:hypothetical protein
LIGLNKQISLDGTNWFKYIGLIPTHNIWYKFSVSNDGEADLAGIVVSDPAYSVCSLPTTLAVGETASCILGPISVEDIPSPDPYINTAEVNTSTYTPTEPITSTAKYGTESLLIVKYALETTFGAEGIPLHYPICDQ